MGLLLVVVNSHLMEQFLCVVGFCLRRGGNGSLVTFLGSDSVFALQRSSWITFSSPHELACEAEIFAR